MEDPSGLVVGQEAAQEAQLRQQQLLSMIMQNKIQQNTMNFYKSPGFQSMFSGGGSQGAAPSSAQPTQPPPALSTIGASGGSLGPVPNAAQTASGLMSQPGQPVQPPQPTPVPGGPQPAQAPTQAGQTPLPVQESQSEAYVQGLQANANKFSQLAGAAFRAGAPGAAMSFMNLANKMGTGAITAKLNLSKMKMNELKSVQTQADLIGQTLGSATTPQEWQQGLLTLEQSGQIPPQHMQQLMKIPFSPQNAAYLQHAGMTASQNANLQMRKIEAENTNAYRQAMLANEGTRSKMELIRTQMEAQRLAASLRAKAAKGKVGAGDKVPNAAMLKAASASVAQSFDDPKLNPIGDEVSEAIASRAQDIMQQNPGISQPEAIQRATAQFRASGALKDQGGNVSMANNGASQYNPVLVPMKGGKPDYIKLSEMAKAQGGTLWVLTKNGPVQWSPQ